MSYKSIFQDVRDAVDFIHMNVSRAHAVSPTDTLVSSTIHREARGVARSLFWGYTFPAAFFALLSYKLEDSFTVSFNCSFDYIHGAILGCDLNALSFTYDDRSVVVVVVVVVWPK